MFIYPIFLQTNLCRHWSQKGSKGRFPGPDKLQNATNQGKEKEKKKSEEEERRRREKNAIVALFRDFFGRKKIFGHKRSVWR